MLVIACTEAFIQFDFGFNINSNGRHGMLVCVRLSFFKSNQVEFVGFDTTHENLFKWYRM